MINTNDITSLTNREEVIALKNATLNILDNLKLKELDGELAKADKKLRVGCAIRLRAIDSQLSKLRQIQRDINHQNHFYEVFFETCKKNLSENLYVEMYKIANARIMAEVGEDE